MSLCEPAESHPHLGLGLLVRNMRQKGGWATLLYIEGVPHARCGERAGFDFPPAGVRLTFEGWGGGSGAIG